MIRRKKSELTFLNFFEDVGHAIVATEWLVGRVSAVPGRGVLRLRFSIQSIGIAHLF
ncbi:hypothetical protein [Virgibacillus halodenitrificans]|uniref:Uncharacterized protein n=2 Tax=Virgibacillus halodenitrificans TaxID=1482 RepID=A0ABR7VLY6_VIRHA|nr:hypothetical protein [Virgibacillus halodenitrificans]MBD1222927.1 hypothetical protein [Virgibacillus halodenitrificans]